MFTRRQLLTTGSGFAAAAALGEPFARVPSSFAQQPPHLGPNCK
jgi:hypothetical protein